VDGWLGLYQTEAAAAAAMGSTKVGFGIGAPAPSNGLAGPTRFFIFVFVFVFFPTNQQGNTNRFDFVSPVDALLLPRLFPSRKNSTRPRVHG
jgi:hypothetical protein